MMRKKIGDVGAWVRRVLGVLGVAAALCLFGGCPDPTDDNRKGGEPNTVATVAYGELESALSELPVNTAETPYKITIKSTNISATWADIDAAVRRAGRYVTLDLSDCAGSEIKGAYSNPQGNDMNIIKDNEYIKGIILPSTLKTIEECAFYGCSHLTTVTIPDSVTSIGWFAFKGCTGLTSVTMPVSLVPEGTYGGSGFDEIFSGYTNLSIVLTGSEELPDYAFYQCDGLTSVTIGAGVASIGDNAFDGCTALPGIMVDAANANYSSRDGVLFNKDKTVIVRYPEGKPGASYTIPTGVTSIGDGAFYQCTGLTSVTIPDSVTSIGYEAFAFCAGLTTVTIPAGVTTIGEWAFRDCAGLTSVTIPAGVTIIDYGTFCNCTGLTSVTIGDSVTRIGQIAFSGCTGLTGVTIPASVIDIGYLALANCTGLISITVSVGNADYSSHDGVLFNKDKTTLHRYPAGKHGAYTIPDDVTRIDNEAFSGCEGLTSVTIPTGVTSIGVEAFYRCKGLTNVTIPTGGIGQYAFRYCAGLTNVTIGSGVTWIRPQAFVDCTGLTSVTFEAGSAISDADFGSSAFPSGEVSSSDGLKNAYLQGGAGTYTRTNGGTTWTKQ